MTENFHTGEYVAEIEFMLDALECDRLRVYQSIERRFWDLCLQKSATARLQTLKLQISEERKQIGAYFASFEASMPIRQSMFRGGEDAKQTYRVLCMLLANLEIARGHIRAVVCDASAWRDRLLGNVTALSAVERDCVYIVKRLHETRESAADFRALLTEVQSEYQEQRENIGKFADLLETVRSIDANIIGLFFNKAETLSDAAHDGANCNQTGLSMLVNELKKEIQKIKI